MREQDNGRLIPDLRHGPGEIVKGPGGHWACDFANLIAETGDPGRMTVLGYPQRMVLENFDASRTQRLPHAIGAISGHVRQGPCHQSWLPRTA
jgi:hypothetical protein